VGQNTSTRLYSPAFRLDAAIHGQRALLNVFPITIAPGLTLAKGSLMIPGSATAVNDVQTITAPGSGTYVLSGTNPLTGVTFSTSALAFGANDAAVQTAINTALTASGGGSVTVASLAVTFTGATAGMPVILMTASAGSVAHTTTGATSGQHTLYAGSGTPTCILQYDTTTDTSGQVVGGEWGQRTPYAQAYFAGEFYGADIPNLDSAAVTAMKARFLTGSLGVTGAILSFN
jgi:hypothetical protein